MPSDLARKELYKYPWRVDLFLEKYRNRKPFTLVRGGETILVPDERIANLVSKRGELKNIKLRNDKGETFAFSDLKKDAEFGGQKSKGLKPSDIRPSIVNVWLTPDKIAENTIAYIKSAGLPKDDLKKLIDLVNKTNTPSGYTAPYDGDIPQAEFFEVLSAIKMAALLKANDRAIKVILGIDENVRLGEKIQINIPQQSNFPLVDYFISIDALARNNAKDFSGAMRISVKSKVKSPKANTVKFNQVFNDKKDVDDWFKKLSAKEKENQRAQLIVAESAMKAYSIPSKKSIIGLSTLSLLNLLKSTGDTGSRMSSFITKYFTSRNVQNFNLNTFKAILTKITDNISNINQETELSKVPLLTHDEAEYAMKLINSGATSIKPTSIVGNFITICDRILESASKQQSGVGHNYYHMFWSEVLTKKEVAYAVATKEKSSIRYTFYSKQNFQAYKDWISLRTTASFNRKLESVMGLDV